MNVSSGAFDLSSIQQSSADPSGNAASDAVYTVEVTAENFQQIVQSSTRHVVVLGLYAASAPASVDFARQLGDATAAHDGAIQVGLVDVDSAPEISEALGVQGVPAAFGIVMGRPVPLFQGTVPVEEIDRYFDELRRLAVQNGLSGRAEPSGVSTENGDAQDDDAPDPRFEAADAAWAAGDFETAIAEYTKLATEHPADAEIAERLAGVKLMSRTRDADLATARQGAAERPDDVDAQLLVADLDVSGGHVDDAFARLLDLIRASHGDERDRIREHLIELFTVVGVSDPRVAAARRSLATALY